MTENLAARGEGLAGLVVKWREAAKEIKRIYAYPQDYSDMRQDGRGEAIGECADELAAALEAAAPAGTAQAQQEFTHDLFAAIHRTNYPGCGDCENFPTTRDVEMFDAIHKVLRRYALATPSPQAPQEQCKVLSTTSAREQSSATASSDIAVSVGLAIYARMVRLSHDSNQTVGEKRDYYVTLRQLEEAFIQMRDEVKR